MNLSEIFNRTRKFIHNMLHFRFRLFLFYVFKNAFITKPFNKNQQKKQIKTQHTLHHTHTHTIHMRGYFWYIYFFGGTKNTPRFIFDKIKTKSI